MARRLARRTATVVATATVAAAGLVVLAPAADAATFTVNSTTDAVDANIGNGVCATAGAVCTLRAAIQEANATPGTDTINVADTTYPLTINGAGEDNSATGDLDVKSDLTIVASVGATVDASAITDRVFHLDGATVTFTNITATGGTAGDGGGIGVYDSSLTMTGGAVSGNAAVGEGGGVDAGDASLFFTDVSVAGNTAGTAGGGIALPFANATLTRVQLSDNSSLSGGGGISVGGSGASTLSGTELEVRTNHSDNAAGVDVLADATASLANSIITLNTTNPLGVGQGGGVRNFGTLTMNGLEINTNTAHVGGGLYSEGASTLSNLEIRGNSATEACGGVDTRGTFVATDVSIIENYGQEACGGLGNEGVASLTRVNIDNNTSAQVAGVTSLGTLNFTDSQIVGNRTVATPKGGPGMWGGILGAGELNLERVLISANEVTGGNGAGISWLGGSISGTDVAVTDNVGAVNGGGISLERYVDGETSVDSELTLDRATISGNTASGDGGGIWMNGATMSLLNVTVSTNTAGADAGALATEVGDVNLVHVTVVDNATGDGAAAISTSEDGAVVSSSSLVTDNSGDNCAGTISSGDFNTVDDATCAPTAPNDQQIASMLGTTLGVLEDNGAALPEMRTHMLLVGNPAIDWAGVGASCPAVDENQETRPQALACDSGAVERGEEPQVAPGTEGPSVAAAEASNTLPRTGGGTAALFILGLATLLSGLGLMVRARRRSLV